jgi:hypothetical protein
VIIELRFSPDQSRQINHLPAGRCFGEGQARAAPRTAFLPGSGSWAPGRDSTFDKVAGYMRFHEVVPANEHAKEMHGRQLELWFVSDGNGFQILRFTKPIHELLGKDKDDD